MISTALALLETDEQRNILSEFYQKYKNRFYAIAYSKLHGKAAAEDAVQEAFLRIVDKPENFFKIEHNKRVAYADVIVRNEVDGASWSKTVKSSNLSMSNTKSGLDSGTYRLRTDFTVTSTSGSTETITVYSKEKSVG